MNFRFAIAAAIIGIIINIVLSKVIPDLLNESDDSILGEVGRMFRHHDETLVSSSIIVATAVFLSVITAQYLQMSAGPYNQNHRRA